jgi:UDP-N-acetylmuramate: L-alanyl-gamma-D-glutamyl-meso-diaminopimelate ligase
LRRNVFQQELIESLTNADEVVMASVYFKQSDALRPEERLDVNAIVAELQRRGRPARQVADANAIVAGIAGELRGGDVVAILSNGGFGGIYEKLPARLHELHAR